MRRVVVVGFGSQRFDARLRACAVLVSCMPPHRPVASHRVVQAVTDDSSSPDIFKTAPPWYPAVPDYVNRTFQYGHAIDSGVKLFYNDYGAGERRLSS